MSGNPDWHVPFALLGLWVSVGVILYYVIHRGRGGG